MKKRAQKGFTLIEMLVVVGIMVVVSGLILANNNRFGGVVLLQNLAYDMALSIRQAQGYGIAVQRFNSSFSSGYGMHFQIDPPGTTQSTYVLFADAIEPADGEYTCPTPGTANCELVQATTIASGYRISSLCVRPAGGAMQCGASTLDILFKRPEPDAYIRSSLGEDVNESAEIHVQSPRGDTKVVTIHANGQIAVQ